LISSSKYLPAGETPRPALLIAILIVLAWPLAAIPQENAMKRGDLAVGPGIVVNDVVVADGNLVISGRVLGSVFVVGGDAMINPGAAVDGNLTVLAGGLWVSRGAAVSGEINVFSGEAHIEEGAVVGSQVRAMEEVSSLTPEKLSLISRYILFNRKTPSDSFELSDLSQLDLGPLRLRVDEDRDAISLSLYELGRTRLDMEQVRGARERIYRGRDIRVRVCVVRFQTPDAAAAFWERLRDDYEEKTKHSVHNSLGDGAHWYFRHRGASYCLWRRDRTFQAVMVRHDDDDPEADEWEQVEDLRDRIILELKNLYDMSGE
jgi:hypothetical protein